MLIIHIFLAVFSIIANTLLLFKPTTKKFDLSFILLGLTLISGTLLVFLNSVNILKTCITGLAYVAFVAITLKVAYSRTELIKVSSKSNKS